MKSVLFLAPLLSAETANPIGQVLDLLQKLYNTVVTDGETEQKQFAKFAEWCEDESKNRQNEIKTGERQSADLKAVIEKKSADISALQARLQELSNAATSNENDLKAATEIRDKEHSTFQKEERELVETVSTLRRAQQVLSRQLGHGGSLAQVPQMFKDLTDTLSVIMDGSVFSLQDKSKLQNFLQASEGEEGVDAPAVKAYNSHSGGIMDILADMQDKAEGLLADCRKAEVNARHNHELLAQSLNNELSIQNEDLSATKTQIFGAGEEKGAAQGSLAATQKDLAEDRKYMKELAANCQQRAVDAEISQKSRAEELKALQEARKIIEESVGGAANRQYRGFIQVAEKSDEIFKEVALKIKALGKKEGNFQLTQLAGQIRSTVSMNADPFEKVKGLLKGMISRLLVEAQEEASHKAFCDKETKKNEAKRAKLEAEVNKLNTRLEAATVGITRLKQEIAELNAAIADIAKSQKDMDTMRASEREEFIKAKADFTQGLEGIRGALRLLREYYQKQGAALVQTKYKQVPTVTTHSASGDSANGIISILEVAESDFARSLAEAQASEDDAISVYDKTTTENKVSTASKRTSVQGKERETQHLEQQIGNASSDKNGASQELAAVMEYLEKLRPQCTVVPLTYEQRKARREQEIEGLKQALTILENEVAFNQQDTSFLAIKRKQHALQ